MGATAPYKTIQAEDQFVPLLGQNVPDALLVVLWLLRYIEMLREGQARA